MTFIELTILAMNISFGSKIPLFQNRIYNPIEEQYENATLYEIDCKDESDLDEFNGKQGYWGFKMPIYMAMKNKHDLHKMSRNIPEEYRDFVINRDRIYSLELEDGTCVGHCKVQQEDETHTTINYIERDQSDCCKYIGQSMIADIAKKSIKEGKNTITVKDPVYSAMDFYTNACGFKESSEGLYLDNDSMVELINKTEEKTKAPICDVVA